METNTPSPESTAPAAALIGFQNPYVVAAGLKLQPLMASHLMILQRIESPIFKSLTAGADQSIKFDAREIIELIYALTHPLPELRALLREGRDAFTERAHAKIADQFPFEVVRQLQDAAIAHLSAQLEASLVAMPG